MVRVRYVVDDAIDGVHGAFYGDHRRTLSLCAAIFSMVFECQDLVEQQASLFLTGAKSLQGAG
tara:strand:- start:4479 stop:4667 length:189 start_codon:yes stop_codon:yes gene_type:complete